jgi:hypothetical protein
MMVSGKIGGIDPINCYKCGVSSDDVMLMQWIAKKAPEGSMYDAVLPAQWQCTDVEGCDERTKLVPDGQTHVE